MNYTEMARLLAAISAMDTRRIDEATVATWPGVLGDLGFEDALEAMRRHFARSTDWLMPAHIREGARLLREFRKEQHEALALPSRWESDPERDARVQRGLAQVAAALSVARAARPRAVEATEKPPPTRSEEIRALAIRRAIAERGRSRAIDPAPLRDRRPRTSGSADWRPVPNLGPVRTCDICKAGYTDDEAGIGAHRTVMGHRPAGEAA